jgi:hypothetical protein
MEAVRSPTRLIACGVFKPALDHLGFEERHPHVAVSFLPSRLHLYPRRLEERLLAEIAVARQRGERVLCLYGECFPDIDDFCSRHGALRVRGLHCFEMLLGEAAYRQITEEVAGTYFLEQDLVLNFEQYCIEPLELHDEEMRSAQFGHYRRLVYVRQPSDPEVAGNLREISDMLGLPHEVRDADYAHLEERLDEVVGPGRGE